MSAFVLLCAAHLDTYISLFAHLGLKNLLPALLIGDETRSREIEEVCCRLLYAANQSTIVYV
jgi:hypothetical protein